MPTLANVFYGILASRSRLAKESKNHVLRLQKPKEKLFTSVVVTKNSMAS